MLITIQGSMLEATLITQHEIYCPLPRQDGGEGGRPVASKLYHVSASNNGEVLSNEVDVLVYDSHCMDCRVDNDQFVCQQKVGGCMESIQ